MPYEIREMKLGGILDQGIAVLKDNFGLLLGVMFYAYIPYQLIAVFVQIAFIPKIDPNTPPAQIFQVFSQIWPILAAVVMVGWLVVLPLTNAAVIYAVAQKYLGRSVTAGEAMKKGLSKVLPLVGTSILVGLSIFVPPLALIIPGIMLSMLALAIVGIFLMLILAIVFGLWFSLIHQVVVLEDIAGPAALGRSRKLVSPYIGTLLVLGIIMMLIGGALGGPVNAIPQPHIQGVLSVIVSAVATMFSTAVFVVFYFSCRSGVENFDLQHLAESVEESIDGDSDSDRSRFEFDDETF